MIHKRVSTVVVLTGPYTGHTTIINGVQFVNGKAEVHGPREQVEGLLHYLGKYYEAFEEGSARLAELQLRDQHGIRGEISENSHIFADLARVRIEPREEFERSEETPAVVHEPKPEVAGVRNGDSDPTWDRHGHSRLVSKEKVDDFIARLVRGLKQLDPDDDSLWTKQGLPQMGAVAKAANIAVGYPLKRSELDAAYPGFNRNEARALREDA